MFYCTILLILAIKAVYWLIALNLYAVLTFFFDLSKLKLCIKQNRYILMLIWIESKSKLFILSKVKDILRYTYITRYLLCFFFPFQLFTVLCGVEINHLQRHQLRFIALISSAHLLTLWLVRNNSLESLDPNLIWRAAITIVYKKYKIALCQ